MLRIHLYLTFIRPVKEFSAPIYDGDIKKKERMQ